MALLEIDGKQSEAYHAGYFTYCKVRWEPGEVSNYYSSGDMHHHQWLYIVSGWAIAEIRDEEDGPIIEYNDTKQPGALIDQTHTLNKWHRLTTTDSHIECIFLNPIPDTSNLNVELVKGRDTPTKEITATDKTITVVALEGDYSVNGKVVSEMKFGRIFSGNTKTINLNENTVIAIVTN